MAQTTDEGVTPAEAFDVLGHEVRVDIVRRLADVRRTNWQWRGMTFAELRKSVGVRDAGNFSYHLEKLCDHFVVKDEEEYKLTNGGMRIVGAVVAGTHTNRSSFRTVQTDIDCANCGDPMTAEYGWELLRISCDDHGTVFKTDLPPGATEARTGTELVEIATLDGRQKIERARRGVCPHCWGPVATTVPADDVVIDPSGERESVPDDHVWAQFDCDRCGMAFWLPVGACLVTEPAVVAFHYDHGIDLREQSYLEQSLVSPSVATLESEDPARIRIDLELDGDTLNLWLDGDLNVERVG